MRCFSSAETKPAESEGAVPEGVDQAKIDALTNDLQAATTAAAEWKEKATMYLADAQNARRIAQEDIQRAKDFSVTKFAKDMLDISDTFSKAIENFPASAAVSSPEIKSFHEGICMTQQILTKTLKAHGVEMQAIDVGETQFNPELHEAVCMVPDPTSTPNSIKMVVKSGYMLKNRVLRAAQVAVVGNNP